MNKAGFSRLSIISGLGLVLAACSVSDSNTADKPVITVSIEPQRQILEQLVGDRFDVVTLLARGSDPETFDPSLSIRRKADNSKAYFAIGAFPFEKKLKSSLPESVSFVDVSKGIQPLYGTHGHHGHAHGECAEMADPHVWTSVSNMKLIAANMAAALCRIDSTGTEEYGRRLNVLEAHLDSLDNMLASKVRNHGAFAIWHPSLSYLAHDYKLEQIAVGHESKEMPAKRLKEVIDSAKNNNVKVLFYQKEYDSRQIESLNNAIGSRMVEIDPLAYRWENELMKIADEIARP